jgi:hypothetical protein
MSNFLSLSTLTLAAVFGLGSIAAGLADAAKAEPVPRVGDPATHANLSVYFLRGPSAGGPVPLTLAEALAKGGVTVHETGNVNRLSVENTGTEDVFIQVGDIVKGGQQDRVLTVSMLLTPKSGQLPIDAFCVEHGRWAARGKEDVKRFASADKSVPSRAAKLAMMAPAKPRDPPPTAGVAAQVGEPQRNNRTRPIPPGLGQTDTSTRQSEVWANVGRIQEKLSSNLKARVNSGQSESSLQLALENEALLKAKAAYVAAGADGDIVGVVIAINGRVSSAETYPSNGLFRKMWPKLIDAAATEAIGDNDATAGPAPTVAMVSDFLVSADQGKPEPTVALPAGLARHSIDGKSSLAVATRRADGTEIHRTYLAK